MTVSKERVKSCFRKQINTSHNEVKTNYDRYIIIFIRSTELMLENI